MASSRAPLRPVGLRGEPAQCQRMGDVERAGDRGLYGRRKADRLPVAPGRGQNGAADRDAEHELAGDRHQLVAEAGAGGGLADQLADPVAADMAGKLLGGGGGAVAGQHVKRLADHPAGGNLGQGREAVRRGLPFM